MTIIDFINLFSTREQALVILMGVLFVLLATLKSTRKPLFDFIKEVTKLLPKLWIPFLMTGVHILLVYSAFDRIEIWTYRLIDELLVFYLVGIGLIFKACRQDYLIFRREVSTLFVGSIFLFAILDEGTFSLATELILIPVVTLLTVMELISKDQQSKNIIKKILAYFGLAAFLYATYSIVNDLRGGNFEPIYEAALSVILPISFIPMLYLIYLIMEYEVVYQAIDRKTMLSTSYRQKLKVGVLLSCHLNPKKLRRMRANLFLIDYHSMSPIDAAKFLSISNEFDSKAMSRY